MNTKRFEQIQSLGSNRIELNDMIPELNAPIIDEFGEDIFEEYILKYLEKNNVSLTDLDDILFKIKAVNGENINKDISIIQLFYNFLTRKILLPDYNTENKNDLFKELDKIIKNILKKSEKILGNPKGFFSMYVGDINRIYDDFSFSGNIMPISINLGGIFGNISIINYLESRTEINIPVKLGSKIKIGENGQMYSNRNIQEKDLSKVLDKLLKGKNGKRKFKQQFGEFDIITKIKKEIDKNQEYGINQDALYKVITVYIEGEYIDDFKEREQSVYFLEKLFEAASFLINEIANQSGIEHKKRILNYSNQGIFEGEAYKNESSLKELEKFEKMKVKLSEQVKLSDIGGQEKAKEEVDKIIKSIQFEDIMKSWGAKTTSGIVFEGPAGTGKTLLAKAIASEVDAEVYNIKLTDIASSAYINEGSKNIKNLFTFIRKKSENGNKVIIILDELDALFIKRGGENNSGEDTKIVNTFLTEMSGLETLENVIFIGTTNLLENIDPAIIRSGRLTTKVNVNLPDETGLKQIYQIHIGKISQKSQKFKEKVQDFEIESILPFSKGLSGADIEEVVRIVVENKALQEISGEEITKITENDLKNAIQKVKYRKKNSGNSIGFSAKMKK